MTQEDKNINDNNYTTRIDEILEDINLAETKEREHDSQGAIIEEITPWVIEFRVIGTPEIIHAPLTARLTLGREDTSNDFFPEIDLTPFNAQKLGVSRKHARILMRNNRITLEDLGSSNGSYINGRRIDELAPTRIQDGDQIKLGNLSLQVHFLIQPHSEDDTLHGFEDNLNIPKIGNGERLLILDDNKEVCAVVRMIALQAGFQISVAHTAQQALSFFDEGDIEGIIVELMLEESNSLDLVDYVRQHQTNPIPIVATTSSAGGYRENQALAKGVNNIFEKPLSIDSIIDALGKFT